MAGSEDEDDYMSMTFADPASQQKETSIQRVARQKREVSSHPPCPFQPVLILFIYRLRSGHKSSPRPRKLKKKQLHEKQLLPHQFWTPPTKDTR
jgi:hypothetical protein